MDIKDISNSERVFQIDRDTFLVYIALHSNDPNPFIRVGSGEIVDDSLLRFIKNVIIPERDPFNVGQEMEWVKKGIELGNEKLSYIGTNDHIKSTLKIASNKFENKAKTSVFKKNQEEEPPIEIRPFGPPSEPIKDHVTINQLDEGNFTVLLGRSRIFDYKNALKTNLNYDKELNQMSDLLSTSNCKLDNKEIRSFIWLGKEKSISSDKPFIYWNLKGRGALLNPTFNYHYTLFEEKINPNNAKVFISHSGMSSGVAEGIKNKHNYNQEIGVLLINEELISNYKHLYPNANIHLITDGTHIPLIKDNNFYLSKTTSHAALSWNLHAEEERVSQILFPLGEGKSKRVFNIIRAPHDLEIQVINSRIDLRNTLSHLSLQIPGEKFSKIAFENLRLKDTSYPLIANKEYVFHEALEAKNLVQKILNCFKGSEYFDQIKLFLHSHFVQELSTEKTKTLLKDLINLKIPISDFAFRNNIYNLLRFIQDLPNFEFYTKYQKILFKFLKVKYNPFLTSYKTWLTLENYPIEFHLMLLGGNRVYNFSKKILSEPLKFKLPPSVEFLEANPKYYPILLKSWLKKIDKYTGDDAKSYSKILDFLEKLYLEKLRLVNERIRLRGFISAIGLGNFESNTNVTNKKVKFIGINSNNLLKSFTNSSILRPTAFTLISLIALFAIFRGISSLSKFGGLSKRGDSSQEIFAASLVSPGKLQKEIEVPGEKDVLVPEKEVSQYVKALAKNNSFLIGKNGPRVKNLKKEINNLDLVFPGDIIKLPDLRLTNVTKGDHVWEIARTHYKKDFARMKIIQKQLFASIDKSKTYNDNLKKELIYKQKLLKRLAVTDLMKKFEKDSVNQIQKHISNKFNQS